MPGEFEERGNHFVLKADNGEVVGTSEVYHGHVERAVDSFKVACLEAIIADVEAYEGDPDANAAAEVLRAVADRYRPQP